MVTGKIRPAATIVAQFAAGVEVEAIQHEGKIYLPVVSMGAFLTEESAPSERAGKKHEPEPAPAKKPETKTKAADDNEEEEETTSKVYTKEELMDTDSKELVKILKNEFGINPDDHEGKNTNKKLRDLILNAQKEEANAEEESEEEETKKKPVSKKSKKESDDEEEEEPEDDGDDKEGDELVDNVADLLEDFDAGKKNKKKTIAAIVALVDDDVDEDKVTELVEDFEEDGDASIDDMAEKIADVLNGKTEKKPAKKSKRGDKKEENLVDPEDLEVGDEVSVWWDDDNQDWFDGEVKSIKKGKITILYDDDTEDVIDPEVHTKIKRR